MKTAILILLFCPFLSFAPNLAGDLLTMKNSLRMAQMREDRIEERVNDIKTKDFTFDLLVEYINLVDPKLPDVPLRQFILETGHFKSKSFTEYNNLSGMKRPSVRVNKVVGEGLNHAAYNHWTDSVDDYIYMINYWITKGYSIGNYYLFLDNINYAEDKNYERKLKSITLES